MRQKISDLPLAVLKFWQANQKYLQSMETGCVRVGLGKMICVSCSDGGGSEGER